MNNKKAIYAKIFLKLVDSSEISMTYYEQYINAIQQRTSPQTKQVLNIYVYLLSCTQCC